METHFHNAKNAIFYRIQLCELYCYGFEENQSATTDGGDALTCTWQVVPLQEIDAGAFSDTGSHAEGLYDRF